MKSDSKSHNRLPIVESFPGEKNGPKENKSRENFVYSPQYSQYPYSVELWPDEKHEPKKDTIYIKKGQKDWLLTYSLINDEGKLCEEELTWHGGNLKGLSLFLTPEEIHKLKPWIIHEALKKGHISISPENFLEEASLRLNSFLNHYGKSEELQSDDPNITAVKAAETVLTGTDKLKDILSSPISAAKGVSDFLTSKGGLDLAGIGILVTKDYRVRIPKMSLVAADIDFFIIYQDLITEGLQVKFSNSIFSAMINSVIHRVAYPALQEAKTCLENLSNYNKQNQDPKKTTLSLRYLNKNREKYYIPCEYEFHLISEAKGKYTPGEIIREREGKRFYFGEGNIYVGNAEAGGLKYIVIAPDGSKIESHITPEEFAELKIPNPIDRANLEVLKENILQVTLRRGHTYLDCRNQINYFQSHFFRAYMKSISNFQNNIKVATQTENQEETLDMKHGPNSYNVPTDAKEEKNKIEEISEKIKETSKKIEEEKASLNQLKQQLHDLKIHKGRFSKKISELSLLGKFWDNLKFWFGFSSWRGILKETSISIQSTQEKIKEKEESLKTNKESLNQNEQELLKLIQKDRQDALQKIIHHVRDWDQLNSASQKNIKDLVMGAFKSSGYDRQPLPKSVIQNVSKEIQDCIYRKWNLGLSRPKGIYIESGFWTVASRACGFFTDPQKKTLSYNSVLDAIKSKPDAEEIQRARLPSPGRSG